MLPSLLALLFTTSLILVHGTEGVSPVNVLLHDASTLHVWVRPAKKGDVAKAYLCPPTEVGTIEQSEQLIAECKQYSSDLWHDFVEINDKTAGAYTLTWTETTHVSLVYVFEPKTREATISELHLAGTATRVALTGLRMDCTICSTNTFHTLYNGKNPSVAVPYWDSALDGRLPNPADSIMWSNLFMGTPSGSGTIADGPLASWVTPSGGPIRRQLGGAGALFTEQQIAALIRTPQISQILAFTSQRGAGCTAPAPNPSNVLEFSHNNVHMWVGGDMGPLTTSPQDPVFFMHHSFVDYVAKAYLCPPTEVGTIEQSEQLIAECKQYSSDLWHDFVEINDKAAGAYTLTWTEPRMCRCQLLDQNYSTPIIVLEEGIRILFMAEEAKLPNLEGSYHFRAPFGWNSDPCGFNRYTMHWGHAVSKDLINWVHLPIFMIPPNLLHLDFENGHFTGSIINLPNGEFGVFWSQRISYFPRGTVTEYPWRETQQYVMTKDLIRPDWTTHKMIIEKLPTVDPPIGNNFHDPVVFLGPGGYYYMTVGSERTGGSAGVVLLYKNKNKRADQLDRDWEYQGILHEDNRDELRMCECPMFIAMGDPLNANTEWVLSYVSDKGSYYPTVGMDAEGRARMNSLFVGHFDGRKFEHRFEQKMDFVGGSFAYQGFYDQQSGRAYLIGWICDIGWIGDTTGDPNFDGRGGVTSNTLPKEFVLSENGQYLMVRPLPELASLREKKPHVITKGQEFHLEKGQAELVFEFSWDNGREETFELHLTPTHTNGKKLELRIDNNGIELKRTWVASNKRMVVYNAMPTKIHIFIDLDTVEYFADDGRWSGAIRLPEASQEKRIGTVELKSAPRMLKESSMWDLNPHDYEFLM
uniref:beta-fructofuranosidase n=1 Tax=Globodera pallida TaxID=36090 RepID=A0A183BZZ4_GLOPA